MPTSMLTLTTDHCLSYKHPGAFGSGKLTIREPKWPCIAHLSITTLREPDLGMIKANILTRIYDDFINL